MVYVLNKCYGGFSLSHFAMENLGVKDRYASLTAEQIVELADLIEEHGAEACSGPFAKLKVVEIPDDCTDWELEEFDGIERITYVLDGKLYHV